MMHMLQLNHDGSLGEDAIDRWVVSCLQSCLIVLAGLQAANAPCAAI
jgi:hypothetical protein